MDIDLFLSPHSECGLLSNGEFKTLPAGVIFDAETLEITLEFIDDTPFHLNITCEEQLRDRILLSQKLYIGFLRDGLMADTIEVPLLFLNDPYGSDFNSMKKLKPPERAIIGFEQFMKRCNFAQPIHRTDLGDENTNGSVLQGLDPKHLEFVPQLVRERMLANAPKGPAGPALEASPYLAPSAPGPRGPGGAPPVQPPIRRMPPKRPPSDDKDD